MSIMKHTVICAYNRLIGCFYPPSTVQETDDKNIIESHVRGVKSKSLKNPEEIKIFKLGEFDDNTGVLTAFEESKLLIDLSKLADPEKVKEVNDEIAKYISNS